MGPRERQKVARELLRNCWMPQRLRESKTISYDFQRAQRPGRPVTKNGTVCHLYHLYPRFTITVLEPNRRGWLCFHTFLLWLVQSVGFLGQENCFLLAVEGIEARYPTAPLSHHPTLAECS